MGNSLDIENSIMIGLLPDIDRDKFDYIGNSSLIGSYLTLISNDA
ncbi:ASKHA domain-containing protein [Faecalibacillus intestinalis]